MGYIILRVVFCFVYFGVRLVGVYGGDVYLYEDKFDYGGMMSGI